MSMRYVVQEFETEGDRWELELAIELNDLTNRHGYRVLFPVREEPGRVWLLLARELLLVTSLPEEANKTG